MCVCVRAFIILSMSLCLFLCCSVFLLFFFLLLMVPVIVLYFYACKWKTKNAKHFLPFFFVLELQRLHLLFSDPCFSCSFFFFPLSILFMVGVSVFPPLSVSFLLLLIDAVFSQSIRRKGEGKSFTVLCVLPLHRNVDQFLLRVRKEG